MADKVEKQEERQEKPAQEKVKIQIESVPLENAIEELMDYGGFDLLKDTIEGAGSMDPAAKARKSIFLTESSKKAEREKLKNTMSLWLELLSTHEDVADMIGDRLRRDEEGVADRRIALSLREQHQHFPLSLGEQGKEFWRRAARR